MSEVNIFEVAAKKKLRFASPIGTLTVEQLYDLPLTAANGVSLNNLAISTNRSLKDVTEESFVETKPNPEARDLEVKLEIIKHVIADKQAAKEAAEKRLANAEKRKKILEALASKQDAALQGKSEKELLKELEALDAE